MSNQKHMNMEEKMKKNNQIVLTTIVLIVLTFSYKYLVNLFLPDLHEYTRNFIQHLLRVLTIVIYITKLGWWKKIGSLKRIPLKSIYLILLVIILAFTPIIYGLKEHSLNMIVMLLITSLLIGFSEECVNRGLILTALKPKGKRQAILISSLIFGLFHLSIIFRGIDIVSILFLVLFAFGFGLVMAVVRYETDSLLVLILIHALWDFMSFMCNPNTNMIYQILVILWGLFLIFKVANKNSDCNEKVRQTI